MGRHSRRGSAPRGDAADTGSRRKGSEPGRSTGAPGSAGPNSGRQQGPSVPGAGGGQGPGARPGYGSPRFPDGSPPHGSPRFSDGTSRFSEGTPGSGVPRFSDGTPAHGLPRLPDGTPAHGFPRLPDGTPAYGFPHLPDGTPPHGHPRLPDGTPAQGIRRFPDSPPPRGAQRMPDGTPAHGMPRVRGGHPEQHETGGGWGELRGRGPGAGLGGGSAPGPGGGGIPRQRPTSPGGPRGPRQDYVDAFDADDDFFTSRHPSAGRADDPYASVTEWETGSRTRVGLLTDARADHEDAPPYDEAERGRGGKGRTFVGIAALSVTTVLALIVAGQIDDGGDDDAVQSQSATDQARDARDPASRSDERPTPTEPPAPVPLTYDQMMAKTYPLSASMDGPGKFDAIPGIAKAPGDGQKFTYRVDVEKGLGLDGTLFAQAVQKTLNDERSWAHDGARTFERIYSGNADFVITLASPGTTAEWCAKSGLDTTVDNVSCDSASTERVMINAYRWAQGSETYGDEEIHAYRQMLINHEVGHRLGFSHVTCDKDGDLAPVMQQQTKFLDYDGIHCLPNAWAYPGS
ncbi:DUF3152 domain-containing protein [Streptomyces sp. NPDC088387]|uniref:DUF3152 domain-containing protein n=1 Tax=Streptomyces sp. NPDC088387 TaxID=3365859 RepID=UPI003819C2B1